MFIEAVSVCVGYADFLAAVVPYNIGLLDRWLIVTSERDADTREVCRRHSLPTLLSEDHVRETPGAPGSKTTFNKGRLIERGLQHLSAEGWRLHLDADIVLPGQFRRLLDAAHLDTRDIYGCDRAMVTSWEQWQAIRSSSWLAHDYHCRVSLPGGTRIGDRWANPDGGYVPPGFFQLWHSSQDEHHGVRIRPYPGRHGNACRADIQHALQWDRNRRQLIPELMVLHLESAPGIVKGANWNGRTTPRFGPAIGRDRSWSARGSG